MNKQGLPLLNAVVSQGKVLAVPHRLEWLVLELQLVVGAEAGVRSLLHKSQHVSHGIVLCMQNRTSQVM